MHWDWIGWLVVAWWAWQLCPIWFDLFRVRSIGAVQPARVTDPELPTISIIVPARDEAAGVGDALARILRLSYPRLEVIAINDRSRDETGEIMELVAGSDPRCRVIHVEELPAGWLGKNHANMLGASHAKGELLLFTDGDVMFEPDLLLRCATAMRQGQLDHLVLLPDTLPETFWESAVMNYFTFLFCVGTRFPLARFHWARNAYVGVGAFNLVRRSAYDAIGRHERLRLEVVDDVMFGKLIKRAGLAQDALVGAPLVTVKWQTGLLGIFRGMEKNAFASANYSVLFALTLIVLQPLLTIGPIVLAFTGPAQLPAVAMTLLTVATMLVHAEINGFPLLVAAGYPFAALFFAGIIARSMSLTLRRGGVTWRDTFYPLNELRRGKV